MDNMQSLAAADSVKARFRQMRWLLALVIVFVLGVFVGKTTNNGVSPLATQPSPFTTTVDGKRQLTFSTFWEAWDRLHEKYLGQLDEKKLYYGSVKGMVGAANDPYTVFADPDETAQFEQTLEGSFTGIGVEIGLRDGLVTVIAPLDGSPAQKAGIREGDVIVGIDKQAVTADMTLDDAVRKIRGTRGTTVTLTIARKGMEKTEEIAIVRDRIDVKSVKLTIKDGVAHVAISSFNNDTDSQFTTVARQISKSKVRGIIVDLRNNPGGFLQTSVNIASQFVPQGELVVTEKGQKNEEYRASGGQTLKDIPLVVLANEGSASASEILAGALRDDLNTTIVGTKTFGKGSVQEFIKLGDGSSMRVTVAKWYTPKGTSINESGIEPSIKVEQNYDTPEDEPLQRATEELNKIIAEKK